MDAVHVVFILNDAYAKHLAVALRSLLQHFDAERELNIYVLFESLSKENKAGLSEIAGEYDRQLNLMVIDLSQLEGIALNRANLNLIMYAPLVAPMLLDHVADKLLFLDVDILVQSDISDLWDTNVRDVHIAAVEEPMIGDTRKIKLGIPLSAPYFNAGVFLINCVKWREDNICNRAVRFAVDRQDIITLHDQDTLNHLLWSSCKRIHPKWNQLEWTLMLSSALYTDYDDEEFWESKNNPCIVHFTPIKPSSYYSTHPMRHKYRDYLRGTIWEDSICSDKSLRNSIRSKILNFLLAVATHEKRLAFRKRREALTNKFSKSR